MNYQTNINDEILDEEETLQKEIVEVKKLSKFRKEKTVESTKKISISNIFNIIAGSFLIFTGFVFLVLNRAFFKEMYQLIILFVATFSIGLIILILGIVFYNKSKKEKKHKKYDVIVVSKDHFVYNKEIEKKADDNLVKIDSNTVLSSRYKEKTFISPLADLEDEDEAVGASKIIAAKSYDFFDLTSEKVLNRFDIICQSNHVKILKNDAISFLSHVLYSRFIIIKDFNILCRVNFSISLEKIFQGKSYYIDCRNIHDEENLIDNSTFNSAFDSAKGNKEDFVFIFLDGIDSDEIGMILDDFKSSIFDKNNPHKIRTKHNDKQYEMLPNIYFIVLLKQKEDTGLYASSEILKYSPILKVDCSLTNDEVNEVIDDKKITMNDFNHLIEELKSEYFLEESYWKKLDSLEKYVNQIKPYQINNDITNAIEKQVAFDYSLRHDIGSLIDDILSVDLLPNILCYIPKNKISCENGLENYISDNFSSEFSIPKTENIFKDFLYTSTHQLMKETVIEEKEEKNEILENVVSEENQNDVIDNNSELNNFDTNEENIADSISNLSEELEVKKEDQQ